VSTSTAKVEKRSSVVRVKGLGRSVTWVLPVVTGSGFGAGGGGGGAPYESSPSDSFAPKLLRSLRFIALPCV
jgi:hypothetical protein